MSKAFQYIRRKSAMSLPIPSPARLAEVAIRVLVLKTEETGLLLKPGETKREVHNLAKKLGNTVTTREVAGLYIAIMDEIHGKVKGELSAMMKETAEQ